MAHKNWSKEQFKLHFYNFSYTFTTKIIEEHELINLNCATVFFLISKKKFPQFETNLFFLKNYKLNYYFQDLFFFKI
jgi:hypothetical protein